MILNDTEEQNAKATKSPHYNPPLLCFFVAQQQQRPPFYTFPSKTYAAPCGFVCVCTFTKIIDPYRNVSSSAFSQQLIQLVRFLILLIIFFKLCSSSTSLISSNPDEGEPCECPEVDSRMCPHSVLVAQSRLQTRPELVLQYFFVLKETQITQIHPNAHTVHFDLPQTNLPSSPSPSTHSLIYLANVRRMHLGIHHN